MNIGFLRLYEWLVLDRPIVTLAVVGALVVLFACFIPRFELDVSADSLVLEHDADLDYYRATRARYGSDDYLVVTYTPEADLFSERTLNELRDLRDRLRALERVASVLSILDVPLLQSPPVTLSDLQRGEMNTLEQPEVDRALARRELQESPIYRNRLLSPDGGTTALQVNLVRDETYERLRARRDELRASKLEGGLTAHEAEELVRVSDEFKRHRNALAAREEADIRRVRAILDRYEARAELHLGGVPMIVADMMRFIRHDLAVFGSAVLGILALLLAVVFQRPHWVLLPLLTALAVGIVTVGFLGLVGWPVTVVSSNFFALLLIFSLSLVIHLIVRYREVQGLLPGATQRTLVSETLRSKAAPCLYTVITTMVAFASLVVSGIRPVIDFGWIMVIAMGVSFLLAFTLFPATLMLTRPRATQQGRDITGAITSVFAWLVQRHGGKVLVLSVLATILSILGMTQLSVENRFIDYFHKSTEIYQGMRLIDERLGGTTPLDVIIDAPEAAEDTEDLDDPYLANLYGDAEGGITATSYWFNTTMLEDVAAIQRYLDGLPETGKVLSLDTAMSVLDALDEDQVLDDFFLSILYKRLPEDIHAHQIAPYLSADGNQLRFAIRVYESDVGLNRQALIEKIRLELTEQRGEWGEQVHLTGMVVLYNNLLQSLFRSQILTLGAVFIAILFTFALVFHSLKIAAIAIAPNLLAVALVLGLLGGLGIPLDIMTITIAAISVGIAVDDTIHYVHRYHDEWRADGDYQAAVRRAHDSIGRAMYYTTLAVTVGFLVLVVSRFVPTIYFGLFTAIAMLTALLANLSLLPVLLRTFRPYGSTVPSSDSRKAGGPQP